MTPIDTRLLLRAAKIWHDADCCLVPAKPDGTKAPFGQWLQYQNQRPDWPQLHTWLAGGDYDGFGIICGAVSGNLEMFEVEGRAADLRDGLGMALIEHGFSDLWLKLCTGYLEQTPSGGYHWLYRVNGQPRRNLKLARRPATAGELNINPDEKIKVLIETRGEGGFTIVAPSGGRTHPAGSAWRRLEGAPATIPTLTVEERDALHAIASTFDQMPQVEAEHREARPRIEGDPLRPGDDYNQRADWTEILQPHGWTYTGQLGGTHTWRRPGKNIGISATTGRNDGDNLYVFSSSTAFETEKPYSKFAAYTLLEHDGDFSNAAKALGRAGYGERRGTEKPNPFAGATPGAEPDEVLPPAAASVDEDVFWSCRPELDHIRTFARARRCSPWAVLGVTLARIITATPQWVVLPALVGSYASLNIFVALVGPSGGGKGAAESAAADCLDMEDVETATVGSGEGIGHLYAHREKGQVIRDRHAVLFTVPEVDNLVALGARQGATLMPQLRSAWSGEKLGFSYADKNKALPIERHTYRMGLVLGVQPGRAAPLLDDADGGTPQRFLWMPVTDPDAPDEAPPVPKPLPWALTGQWKAADAFAPSAGGIELCEMPIPDEVRQQVGRASLDRLRAQTEALDGHSMLARLKLAAALALLDRRKHVTMDDWELSAQIMTVSNRTRESVVTYLSSKARQANQAKGEGEAQRAVMVADRVAEEAVKRVARRVLSHLRKHPDGMARHELRKVLASRDRQYFEEAVDRLSEAGTAVAQATEHGERIKVSE